ncbi:RDD family protein [Microbacterium tumbae]
MTMVPFGQIAPIPRRAVAYLLDAVIASGLGIVLAGALFGIAAASGSLDGMLSVMLVGLPVVSLLLLGWTLVYTFMQAGAGSIGMRAQGVRLVDAQTGQPLGFGRALLRNIIFGLAGSIVVGYFSPLFDGSGRFQGWHDKVARSLVVDVRAAAQPVTTAIPVAQAPGFPAPLPSAAGGQAAATGFPPSAPSLPPGAPAPIAPGHPGAVAPAASSFPAYPAPAFPPAPAPSFGAAPPATFAAPVTGEMDQTIVPPRPPVPQASPAEDSSSLIAFVPGVTLDSPPPRHPAQADPASAQPAPAEAPLTAPSLASAPPAAAPPASADPVAPPAPAVVPAPATGAAPVDAPAAPEGSFVAPEDGDIEQTRISVPGHRLVFIWDDGTRVAVSRRTVFGRNPAAEDGAVVVPVRDETLSLSKTHFEVAAETSGGWLVDRDSTNGTTIIRDGASIACPPGQRVSIKLGDVIAIGDRVVTVGGYE